MLNKMIQGAQSIAIGGHIRPDGDCVGSCMGLYHYICNAYPEKEISVYLEEIPDTLKFIKRSDEIRHEIPEGKVYDLFILLDCGDEGRLGFSVPLLQAAKHSLCIDHHKSNQAFADENHIDPEASSTSELVYQLIDHEKITKEIAECLYTGMVHDTGIFRYPCTHPSTMIAAADLMGRGIDFTSIITKTFDEKTYLQNKILGKALLESVCDLEGKVISAKVSKADMLQYGIGPRDLEGIVSQLKLTSGVEVSVFLYELEEGNWKISLRSNELVDVSSIAQQFGGGGHARAAGCTYQGKPEDGMDLLKEKIKEQLTAGEDR